MKKGSTLIEVVVGFAVFAIMLVGVLVSVKASMVLKEKQTEVCHFISICEDIDKYYTEYNKNWSNYYCDQAYVDDSGGTIYYDEDYQIVSSIDGAKFKLTYRFEETVIESDTYHELHVSAYNIVNDQKTLIEDINFGGKRYEP